MTTNQNFGSNNFDMMGFFHQFAGKITQQENEYDKEEFGNYLNQANDLLNLDMYYGIIKAAAIKLARFENDGCYYYTPIIIFSDGSSYSFEEFFTESNFKNLLGTVETILKEYEEMYQNTIND